MTTEPRTGGSGGTTALGVGAVAAMLLCCLGPALLVGGGLAAAGGTLAAIGGFLSSPITVVSGLVLAGVGLIALLRRRGSSRDDSCCLPGSPAAGDRSGRADRLGYVTPAEGPTGGDPR